jgi:hypothetical protein
VHGVGLDDVDRSDEVGRALALVTERNKEHINGPDRGLDGEFDAASALK